MSSGTLRWAIGSRLRAERSVFLTGEHHVPPAQPPALSSELPAEGALRAHTHRRPQPGHGRLPAAGRARLPGADPGCAGSEAAELPACSEAGDPLHQSEEDAALPAAAARRTDAETASIVTTTAFGNLMQFTPCCTHNAHGVHDVHTHDCCLQVQLKI